jgi:hypothetical protein
MHQRRITLADGRYLIFYTFDALPAPASKTEAAGESRKPEAEAEPEAEEERRV